MNMRLITLVLILSYVKPLPEDMSNMSELVTVATRSPANQAQLEDLESYQSGHTMETLANFMEHVGTSQKVTNKSSLQREKEELIKSKQGAGKNDLFENDGSLQRVDAQNRTPELTTSLLENISATNVSGVFFDFALLNKEEEVKEKPLDEKSGGLSAKPVLSQENRCPLGLSVQSSPPPLSQKETGGALVAMESSGDKTKYDDNELDLIQELSLSDSNLRGHVTQWYGAQITTMTQENASTSHHGQVTSVTLLGEDGDIDLALTFTCQGRCDKEICFPSSCSATSIVYGTCRDNLAKDCPHVWEEGRISFEHMRNVGFIFDENFVYKISTCPRPVQKHVEQKESERSTLENVGKLESQFSIGIDNVPATEGGIKSSFTSPATKDETFQDSRILSFTKALSFVPVTDSATGLTFVNKTIYDCHNMSQSTALPWSLKFNYDFISPTKLEDFNYVKSLSDYYPGFNKNILKAHLCYPDLIETCSRTADFKELSEMYAQKCQKSEAVVISKFPRVSYYSNRFCAYCNEGRYRKYVLSHNNHVKVKGHDFFVLMSLSESKAFNFKLISDPSSRNPLKFPWSEATCSVPPQDSSSSQGLNAALQIPESGGDSVCSITCDDPSFTLRSDGLCKARHVAFLALADDGLAPLCPLAMTGLANYLACGLEDQLESLRNADVSAESVSPVFDSTYNKTLYVVKLRMELPEQSESFFSNSGKGIYINIYRSVLLVKAFQTHPQSREVCHFLKKWNSSGVQLWTTRREQLCA
ncbi:hypothetical protein PoB_003316800 [Plakobranchus ocellatus]|uniref:MACPF domain-containing protein n=1 Tax=Plakobranchus ocellatus TaxID=259542 RepID=A0AAV4AIP8_9GAST|nr:hypothetical protein PoB_003316800 [Plakobranchus ocellatus]